MEPKRMIGLVTGIVIAIVVTFSLLMPIVSNAEIDKMTGTNTYQIRMSEIGDETVTLSYDSESGVNLYNGETTNFLNSNGSRVNNVLIIADSLIVTTTGAQWYYYFVYEGADVQIWSSATGANTAVATIGNGSIEITIDENTQYEIPYDWCYIPDNDGDFVYCTGSLYGLFKQTQDLTLVISLRSNHGVASGTIESLTNEFHATDGTVDTETFVFPSTYDTETVGVTDLCKTPNNGYGYILPLKYTYYTENEYSDLFSVIPILITVGIVMMPLGMIISRRE